MARVRLSSLLDALEAERGRGLRMPALEAVLEAEVSDDMDDGRRGPMGIGEGPGEIGAKVYR